MARNGLLPAEFRYGMAEDFVMNVRSMRYNQDNTIDCEIEHHVYGWIPFTASPDDTEKHGRSLYAAAVAGEYGDIEAYSMTVEMAVSVKIAELSAACRAQIVSGYDSTALGTIHHYPAQDQDQANMVASVTASMVPGLPADWVTPFWCADGTGTWAFRPHTAAQIQQAGIDGKAAITVALERNAMLSAQVQAIAADAGMTDADKIAAISGVVW